MTTAYPSFSGAKLLLLLLILNGCSNLSGELNEVPAKKQSGFNYPYFLFIPQEALKDNEVSIIIEPNNTGFTSDDFDDHMESAQNLATNKANLGNFLSHQLGYPLLIPMFPRSKENWKVYTHALDRDVMLQKGNDLERIDLQLIAMVEDAKRNLAEMGFKVKDKFIMTGFSASGTFANRFAAIHPNKVAAYAAGGINGILILPRDTVNGQAINYPLGTNDFLEITGHLFDSTAFQNTPQFLYMGELDENDAAAYSDAYDQGERAIIYSILGEKMQPNRWEKCVNEYQIHNINAQLKIYDGIGHEITQEVKQDILRFFKENIKGNE